MHRSFAVRLAVAFAAVGILGAALTSLLVNLAFGSRFDRYLQQQRLSREQAEVRVLEDSYRRMGGWNAADLRGLSAVLLMDGGTLRLLAPSGATIWAPRANSQMAQMHREMMGSGPLGPEDRLAVRVNGVVVGTAVMRVPEPGLLPQDLAFRSSINRLLFLGGLVAAGVALLLGVGLARRATAPARELSRAARALAGGDRSSRAAVSRSDEFGEMARSFNRMADAVEEEDRLRRTFAADVAHEVRTPLAILRSQVEAMQDGVIDPAPAELESLHEEVLRIGRLVADLETLASAEAAGFALEREPVALGPLLEDAVREFRGAAESGGVRVETDLGAVTALADPTRVRQIVSNLLSNALKFTPSGGRVGISLGREGAWAVVRVADSGTGIPPDELPHVFDRFYRGRQARAGGSGIGLTVVRQLVLAHGGRIEAASREGAGATFTVRLPASPEARPVFTAPSHAPATVSGEGGA